MFLLNYLKFLLTSQNQHGLHSPFVYSLVTECFYDKKKYKEYAILKDFRRDLLRNKEEIKVTDFGAGSKVFKSDRRKVADIARHVGISEKRARLLFRLVNYLGCRNALELGTSVGIGTSALAANKITNVTSIEGCPETARIAQQQFQKFGLENIELRVGKFENVLEEILGAENFGVGSGEKTEKREGWKVESGERIEKRQEKRDKRGELEVRSGEETKISGEWKENREEKRDKRKETREENGEWEVESQAQNRQPETWNQKPETSNLYPETLNLKPETRNRKFDLVYFDGNHQKEATLNYFQKLLPATHNDSVFIFDDIHWSQGMEEAWETIRKHPSVKVSIDTFHIGLVFFRREQAKQHFKIRL